MWEVTSLAGAIPAVLIGWITLGLMPICWKVLERRGRCLGHTLLDFSFVSLLGGCGAALLFGSLPRETAAEAARPDARQDILPQLGQHNSKLVGFALASGACFTFADVFLQQAMPLVGLVTAAAISNALRIIISVMTNYFLDGRLDDGTLLFPGLALALAAIVCSTAAQVRHRRTETEQKVAAEATRREAELCDLKVHQASEAEAPPLTEPPPPDPPARSFSMGKEAQVHPQPQPRTSKKSLGRTSSKPKSQVSARDSKDTSPSGKGLEQASPNPMIRSPALSAPSRRSHAQDAPVVELMPKPGDLQDNKMHQQTVPPTAGDDAVNMSCIDMKASRAAMLKGLALSAACGISYGLYSPAFNIATNDHFNMAGPGAQPMNAWTAILYLYLGLWFVSFIINTYFLYRPPQGPASTITKYTMDWWKSRGIAILSGIFGLISAIAELVGGQAGGYAFASLVAAYPLVTTIVGMVCFGEFRNAARSTQILLAAMFTLYLAAVALIASSAKLRPAAQR